MAPGVTRSGDWAQATRSRRVTSSSEAKRSVSRSKTARLSIAMFAINLPISRRRIRKVGAAKSNYRKTGDDLADFQKKNALRR
jgi:hypothetical protein